MNSSSHHNDDQQHRLDLLVDGELSDAERRQLLSSLDEQPGGWRQCALAFLEAQSWGHDLKAIAQPAAAGPAPAQPRAQHRWLSHNPGTLLALAASVLVCFGLGFRAHDWWPTGSVAGLAGGASSQDLHPAAGELAGQARTRRPLQTPAVGFPLGRSPADGALDQVTLVVDDDQAADAATVEIPIVRQHPTTGNLFGASAPVPADVLQALERLGSRVRQHQQLIPVRMKDGREAIVPVNRIELEPVNLRNYQ